MRCRWCWRRSCCWPRLCGPSGARADPLLELRLFRDRPAAAACAINGLAGFALALALANVPLFINTRLALFNPSDPDILRRAAWDSGWVLSALTLAMAAAAPLGGRLAGRFGARWPTATGMALAAGGYLLLSRWQAGTGYAAMVAGLATAGVGSGAGESRRWPPQ